MQLRKKLGKLEQYRSELDLIQAYNNKIECQISKGFKVENLKLLDLLYFCKIQNRFAHESHLLLSWILTYLTNKNPKSIHRFYDYSLPITLTSKKQSGVPSQVSHVYETYSGTFESFIIKYKKSELINHDVEFLHETFVGLILNELRKYIPTFVYTYGSFQSTVLQNENDVLEFDYSFSDFDPYCIVLEKIESSFSLEKYISNGCTVEIYSNYTSSYQWT